jgi:hypothetical protein
MPRLDFQGIEPSSWLASLPPYNHRVIQEMLKSEASYERVAEIWLSQIGSEKTAPLGSVRVGQSFFQNIKDEFSKLICGDPKYKAIRQQVKKVWRGQQTTIVSAIAVAIAANVGVAAAAIVPAIALLLGVVSNVGVNAWCGDKTQSVTENRSAVSAARKAPKGRAPK